MNFRNYPDHFSPHRILVVDDEESLRNMLSEALPLWGHVVETASDGQDAVEKLQNSEYDVVITDLSMPRVDGMELIRYITRNWENIDIIAMTAYGNRYKYVDVITAGATDFIIKPFTLDELEAKLKRLLRERLLRKKLQDLAIRDFLTGLYNRRHFEETLAGEAVRAVRYKHPLSLIFLDIDGFKDYNDKYGHQKGDELLVKLANVLQTSIREHVDKAFRYGGDEFTVILPCVNVLGATRVAERIQNKYDKLNKENTALSMGVSEFHEDSKDIEQNIDNMVRRADESLYFVKKHFGGGRIYGENVNMPSETVSAEVS